MIVGRVGKDPVIRKTQTGKSVCELSVATTENKITEWHKIVTWDKTADFCSANIQKGSLIYVEGPCEMKKSTGVDGKVYYSKETVGLRIVPLSDFGKKQGVEQPASNEDDGQQDSENYNAPSPLEEGVDDDELPF